jgi:hypothetical protein
MELTREELSELVEEAAKTGAAVAFSQYEHKCMFDLSSEDAALLVALARHLTTLRERGAKVTWTIVLTVVGVFSTVAAYKILDVFDMLPRFRF